MPKVGQSRFAIRARSSLSSNESRKNRGELRKEIERPIDRASERASQPASQLVVVPRNPKQSEKRRSRKVEVCSSRSKQRVGEYSVGYVGQAVKIAERRAYTSFEVSIGSRYSWTTFRNLSTTRLKIRYEREREGKWGCARAACFQLSEFRQVSLARRGGIGCIDAN